GKSRTQRLSRFIFHIFFKLSPMSTMDHASPLGNTLIFTTTYNEAGNIAELIHAIFDVAPDADVLVIDDNSPDGTYDIIEGLKKSYPRLYSKRRPRKLGIGSAHKYALIYAMKNGYDRVLTMDADFSHNPRSIPDLLAASGHNIFVTGSRYCEGGKCDYTGYRDKVSRLGNFFARALLNLHIKELTTFFRVFDVELVRRLPLRRITSDGYSYGVSLVYYLRKIGAELREVPIHFIDRQQGSSKIPRLQIITSAVDLFTLSAKRLLITRDIAADMQVDDPCALCGEPALTMKHGSSRQDTALENAAAAYHCTAVGGRSYPAVYKCLHCGHEQVPKSQIPENLEHLYAEVVDEKYLQNKEVKQITFKHSFDQISKWLPQKPGSLLEIGSYCGFFLEEARRRGWQGAGVESSVWASRYAREVTGVDVFTGYLDEDPAKFNKLYDVVVSFDVIEHVRNPMDFMSSAAQRLETDGLFFFSTMDNKTWAPRLLGKSWPWLMDMHLHYFHEATLRQA
ncbi:MAG: methyltransferase domain-containing protein, partial [Methylocystaceae bacterium]|nr:methyltransferase domain-containing protein [Methylocystaceae bacterium]